MYQLLWRVDGASCFAVIRPQPDALSMNHHGTDYPEVTHNVSTSFHGALHAFARQMDVLVTVRGVLFCHLEAIRE